MAAAPNPKVALLDGLKARSARNRQHLVSNLIPMILAWGVTSVIVALGGGQAFDFAMVAGIFTVLIALAITRFLFDRRQISKEKIKILSAPLTDYLPLAERAPQSAAVEALSKRELWRTLNQQRATDFIFGLLDAHPDGAEVRRLLPTGRYGDDSEILSGRNRFEDTEGSGRERFAAMNAVAAAFYLYELIQWNSAPEAVLEEIAVRGSEREAEASRVIEALLADLDQLSQAD